MPSPLAQRLSTGRSQVETRQGWTVSFTEAAKADLIRQKQEESATRGVVHTGYDCGNNDSSAFLKKMSMSIAEASRVRQQCRFLAHSSEERRRPESVSLSHCRQTIETAKDVSEFAKGSVARYQTGFLSARTSAPASLGHLGIPAREAAEEGFLPAIKGLEDKESLPPRGESATPSTEAATSRLGHNRPSSTPSTETGGLFGRDSITPANFSPPPGTYSLSEAEEAELTKAEAAERETHEAAGYAEQGESDRRSLRSGPEASNEEEDYDDDLSSDESEADRWPPKPPLLKFKMVCQFNERFEPSAQAEQRMLHSFAERSNKLQDTDPITIEDPVVTLWLNRVFQMKIQTSFEFENGYPLIILTILDAVYGGRVRWRQVDWNVHYKRALNKNYAVLTKIWDEVNMDKAREFRVENTTYRLEHMPTSTLEQKLEFLKIMKRFFDARIHNSGPYDPQANRLSIVRGCKAWGHQVEYPPWMLYDKSMEDNVPTKKLNEFEKMPEFKRLIYYMGSPDHLTL